MTYPGVTDIRSALVGFVALFAVVAMTATGARAADARQQWSAESIGGQIVGVLQPVGGRVELGEFQQWMLSLETKAGAPVENAVVAIGGGMPGHGHGLPTQPKVTRYFGSGRYLIEGVKLSMAGQWVIAAAISTQSLNDRMRFELVVNQRTADDFSALGSLRLDAATRPPSSLSNRFADNADAARFGRDLFFDVRLSANGQLSCASCHQPGRYFADGKARGEGLHTTNRNTPTLIGAAYLSWFYWDGRRDSLWSQALVPFEAANELGSSRTDVVRRIGQQDEYRRQYEAIFGQFPSEVLAPELPLHASPLGTAEMRTAWSRIDPQVARQINQVFANLGKAIAAYERTLPVPVSRFDTYVEKLLAGDPGASEELSEDERNGLGLFLDPERTHCMRCHNGTWFTNGEFHNIGTGRLDGPELDFGRAFGIRAALLDEFNCVGPYSDAETHECRDLRFMSHNSHVPLEGAFKVPSLRNVAATAPYMHDGRFDNLESVVDYYRSVGNNETALRHELPPLEISDDEARQLVAFLRSLSITEH